MKIPVELFATDADRKFWQENGYWKSKKLYDNAFLEDLKNAMYRLWAAEFETGCAPYGGPWHLDNNFHAIRKMDNAHWANKTIRELATSPLVGAVAAKLTGSKQVKLWHDQLLYKPGNPEGKSGSVGGNIGWHQDHNYWQCTSQDLFTAWVAFDDVTLDKGCMQVVPGSHQWGFLEGDFFEQDMDKLKASLEKKSGKEFQAVPLELKAGEVSFHHCMTIHGSGPNVLTVPRRSLVMHLMPGTARYVAGTSCDNHMNAILMRQQGKKDGDIFEGDSWPVLFDEESLTT